MFQLKQKIQKYLVSIGSTITVKIKQGSKACAYSVFKNDFIKISLVLNK